MKEYHKIQTVFKRDMENEGKSLLVGQWTMPEFERRKEILDGLITRECTCKINEWWLQRPDVEDVARKLSLDIVPVIGSGTLHECIDRVRNGMGSTWCKFEAEGIVARPATELVSRGGHRIITKIKCRDFR